MWIRLQARRLLLAGLLLLGAGVASGDEAVRPQGGKASVAPWAEASPPVRQMARLGGRFRRLAVDAIGRVLMGGQGCVHRYDGHSWERLPVPGDLEVSALAVGADGAIWVATERELGCLRTAPDGSVSFDSLNGLLSEADLDHGHVYDVFIEGEEVLFCTTDKLFRYHAGKLGVTQLPAVRRLFVAQVPGLGCFVHSRGVKGLFRLSAGQEELSLVVPNHTLWALMGGNGITSALPHAEGVLLLSSMGKVVLLDAQGRTRLLTWELGAYCETNQFERAIALSDGSYAVGTMKGGVVLADREGRILRILTKARGDLPSDHVTSLVESSPGTLWVATTAGLTECRINPALTVLDERAGIVGRVHSLRRHEGRLWLGLDGGAFTLAPATGGLGGESAVLLKDSQNFVTDFLPLNGGLLLSTVVGLKWAPAGGFSLLELRPEGDQLASLSNARKLLKLADDRVAVLTQVGLFVVQVSPQGNRIVSRQAQASLLDGVFDPADASKLIVRTGTGSLFRFSVAEGARPPEPLPLGGTIRGVFQLVVRGDSVYAHTTVGTWALRPGASSFSFVSHDIEQPTFWTGEDEAGNGWVIAGSDRLHSFDDPDGSLLLFKAETEPMAGWVRRGAPLVQVSSPGGRPIIHCDREGVIWVAGEAKLLRIDTRKLPVPRSPHEGRLHLCSLLVGGLAQTLPAPGATFSLPAGSPLTLSWCMPVRGHEGPAHYQYLLSAEGGEWSTPTQESTLTLQRLSPGKYHLRVRCATEQGGDAGMLSLAFEIPVPWYQTWPAWVAWCLLGFLSLAGLLHLNGRRHRARQHQLESLVTSRTQSLREANQLLHATTQAKTEFVRNVSHELRNPIAGARMMADLLLRSQQTEGQRQQAEQLRGCLGYLQRLLDSSLDLARLEAGQVPFVLTRIDLGRLLRDTAALFEGLAAGKGLFLRVEAPEEGAVLGLAEATHLQRVLINYLGNAFKFTVQGGVVLGARPAGACGSVPLWRITVLDTGAGVPEALRPMLFRPFMRDTRAGAAEGTQGAGLGLSLCVRLAELSGGTVGFEPGPGEGSLFHVDWPLLPVSSDPDTPVDLEQVLASAQVLLVEEDEGHRDLLLQFLEQLGVSVRVCNSVDDAERMLCDGGATVALLSHHQGNSSAFELLARCRAGHPAGLNSLHLCLLTAQLVDGIRDAALAAGFDAVYQRPVSLATLVSILQQHRTS